MTQELPEPWAAELSSKGMHSFRAVALRIGVSPETVRRLMTGGSTSAGTVEKVADEFFDGNRTKVWELYGVALKDYGPWELPPEASLLNSKQRAAVLAVVNAMLPPNLAALGGDGNADDDSGGSAPTIRAVRDVEEDLAAYEPDPE